MSFQGGVTDSSQILSEEGLYKKRSESQPSDETLSVKRSDSRQSSSSEKTKKKSTWYNPFIANYKSKCDDFQRIFGLPQDERLLVGMPVQTIHGYAFSPHMSFFSVASHDCIPM